jgi:predicted permease
VTGISSGLKSPLLWAPILGIAVVLASIHLPAVVTSCFELIGSATSGVAVFAVGLVLASHPVRLSPGVFAGSLARITIQSAVLFALLHLLARRQSLRARDTCMLQFSAGYGSGTLCGTVQSRTI